MMQWDIGYGKFGFGLTYRPRLELTYTIEPTVTTLYAKSIHTISKNSILENEISSGFDDNGKKIYSILEFNLSSLPSYENTIITNAYVELNSTKIYLKEDIRFHLEFIQNSISKNYKDFENRKIIQNIGYDISANELKNNQTQYFVFDSFAKIELNEKLKDSSNILFALKPTTSKKSLRNRKISWETKDSKLGAKTYNRVYF